MTARLTFISHAETPATRRAAFPLDEALERATLEKLASLRWNAPQAQETFSGPEQRVRMTALSLNLKSMPIEALRDCGLGTWQGRDLDEVHLDDPAGVASWLSDPTATPHGGESIAMLIDRAAHWLASREDAGHTIAITHPAVIRGAIISVLGAPLQSFWRVDIPPLSLTDLRWNGSQWSVRAVGIRLDHVA